MSDVRCETCKWNLETFCHRMPPTAIVIRTSHKPFVEYHSLHPIVQPTNFCGEWTAKKPQGEPMASRAE